MMIRTKELPDLANSIEPAAQNRPVSATEKPTSRITRMDGLLLVTMVLWATNYVVAKSAVSVIPVMVFNAFRFSLGAFSVFLLLKLSGEKLTLPRREWKSLILLAFMTNIVYQSFFMNGLHQTTVANSVLIGTMAPVWIVLINFLRGQEYISRIAVIGTFLALGGVVVVIISRYADQLALGGATLTGDLLTIIASFVWAMMVLLSRKPLMRNPTIPASFWILLWGAFFSILLALPDLLRMEWSVLQPNVAAGVLYSGVLSIGLAGSLWNRAIKELGAARPAVFVNLQPLIAATVAILFLGESFTIWLVIGTLLVLTGVAFVKKG
jgi:drug/metabolite transporter (DMT)-like permease